MNTNIQHGRKRTRPAIAAALFFVLATIILLSMFGLGYYVGQANLFEERPAKAVGEPFEHKFAKQRGPVFEKQPSWHEGLEPCAAEDSLSCYWDATTMGNGLGRSFIVDDQGNVTYITPEELP